MSSRTVRGSRRYRVTTLRRSKPIVDHLESRALLSTMVARPTFVIEPFGGGAGPGGGFTPAQMQEAYGFNSIVSMVPPPARAKVRRSRSSMPTTTPTSSPI